MWRPHALIRHATTGQPCTVWHKENMRPPASAAEAWGLSRTSRCCSTLPDRSRRARSCSRFLVLKVVRALSLPSALQRATTSRTRPASADCAAASLSCPTLPVSPTCYISSNMVFHSAMQPPDRMCWQLMLCLIEQGLRSNLASNTPPPTACMHGVGSQMAEKTFVYDVTCVIVNLKGSGGGLQRAPWAGPPPWHPAAAGQPRWSRSTHHLQTRRPPASGRLRLQRQYPLCERPRCSPT